MAVANLWNSVETESSFLIEREISDAISSTDFPIAIDTIGAVSADTRLRVIELAHGNGILREDEVDTTVQHHLILLITFPMMHLQAVAVGISQVGITLCDVQRICGIMNIDVVHH